MMAVFQHPCCLISSSDSGVLRVEHKVLEDITKIKDPLVVVSIVGLYRTGKSFLMNRLAQSNQGFLLGKTIESKTKGIWIWCRNHPTQPGTVLVLLDTEGLGDVHKGDSNHDNKLFTLSLLICDVLCYNIMVAFDQDAIERITLISKLVQNRLGALSKEFILCVRDFSLMLEKDGETITEDEYLEQCLGNVMGTGEKVLRANEARTSIKRAFPVRKCFTFDRPVGRKKLQHLETLTETELSKSFLEDADKYVKYIYSRRPKRLTENVTIDGKIFSSLLLRHVELLHSGLVPDIKDTLMRVLENENEQLVQDINTQFFKTMESLGSGVIRSQDFQNTSDNTITNLIKTFRQQVRIDTDHKFENKLQDDLSKAKEAARNNNMRSIANYCASNLQSIYSRKIGHARNYFKIGGHEEYRRHVDQLKTEYQNRCRYLDSAEADRAFKEFMNRRSDEEQKIIAESYRLRKKREEELQAQLKAEQERKDMETRRRIREFQRKEEERREIELEIQRRFFDKQNERLDRYAESLERSSLICPICGVYRCPIYFR